MHGTPNLLADPVAVARAVLLDVDMEMVVVGLVRAGAEDRREPAAGRNPESCERRIRCCAGFRLDKDDRSIGELEAGDVDGKSLRVGRKLARCGAVPIAAFEARTGSDGPQLRALDAGNQGSDQISNPVTESVGEPTRQHGLVSQANCGTRPRRHRNRLQPDRRFDPAAFIRGRWLFRSFDVEAGRLKSGQANVGFRPRRSRGLAWDPLGLRDRCLHRRWNVTGARRRQGLRCNGAAPQHDHRC